MAGLSFVVLAGLTLTMAAAVVVARDAFRSALALVTALASISGLFVLLDAPFLAAMQVLVYAGAIMVLFLFVIMLLNLGPDGFSAQIYVPLSKGVGALAGGFIAARLVPLALWRPAAALPLAPLDGSVRRMGATLMGESLFAFEAISVLLLVAVVGAVVLSGKRAP